MVFTNTSLNIINNIQNYWFNFKETGKEIGQSILPEEDFNDPGTSKTITFLKSTDQSISISIQIEKTLLSLRNMSIIINHPEDIRDYLINHNLEWLLLPICQKAKALFQENAKLYLEVYHDPEVKDKYLTLYIRQDNYYKDILEIIEELSEDFEELISDTSGWFLITTDFAPPR
jgi:hypothetical protein